MMSSGSSATEATNAKFHSGRRNRRPTKKEIAMRATPQIADGNRKAHSDSPNTETESDIR